MFVTMLIGGVMCVALEVALLTWRDQPLTWKKLALAFLSGAVGGALFKGALVAGGLVLGSASNVVVASAVSGGGSSAVHRIGLNAEEGRPLLEGTTQATAQGAAFGAALPLAGRALAPVVRPIVEPVAARVRGAVGVLRGEAPGEAIPVRGEAPVKGAPVKGAPIKGAAVEEGAAAKATGKSKPKPEEPGLAPVYATVHPPAPAWLAERMEASLAAVARNAPRARGPPAEASDVAGFLHETYEHVREVNALIRALGGRPRPIPSQVAPSEALSGIHDFGERVSLRRLEAWLADLRQNPLRDRDGKAIPVPEWLENMVADARAAGERSVDVGKLSPQVAAGLGRAGPPEPYAIRLHNLSAHHVKTWPENTPSTNARLLEMVADTINAMRQPRVYRPRPLPFATIRETLQGDVAAGRLPASAREVIDHALEVQAQLERSGQVNPYYLLEQ
ncbi:MAG: hypothetical protein AB7N76_26035 [Planctomycetota bacterium]